MLIPTLINIDENVSNLTGPAHHYTKYKMTELILGNDRAIKF